MRAAILIDFGSTFTKVVVVDMEKAEILLSTRFASTVKTDAKIGLKQCLDAARSVLSDTDYRQARKLASSSAAGGLRMAVLGISPTLSLTAGKNAACGAGAKILKTISGKLTKEAVRELERLKIEILLFCGGYEKGNRSILYHNAQVLSHSSLFCPIIYAGNSEVASDVRSILTAAGKECFLVPNIIPEVGQLNTAPAENIIREVFLKRIIHMKGLDTIKDNVDAVVMPTPAAVLRAGELLAKGTKKQEGLGPLMLIDIGGATTDIHSYVGQSQAEGAKLIGVREPFAKRTVEGDLGMRESARSLLEEMEASAMPDKPVSDAQQKKSIEYRLEHTEYVADNDRERELDFGLARGAAYLSVRRHAGMLKHVLGNGGTPLQIGKNLSEIRTVIGTGGPIVHSPRAREILLAAEAMGEADADMLLPEKVDCCLDREYVLYAAGLLRDVDEEVALAIMKKSIVRL